MSETKKWWQSKVLWINLLGFVAFILPSNAPWISSHLSESGGLFAAVNFILRLFFTDKAIE